MLLEKKEQFSRSNFILPEESRKTNCHLFQMVGFDDKKEIMYKLSPFRRRNKFSYIIQRKLRIKRSLQKKIVGIQMNLREIVFLEDLE